MYVFNMYTIYLSFTGMFLFGWKTHSNTLNGAAVHHRADKHFTEPYDRLDPVIYISINLSDGFH